MTPHPRWFFVVLGVAGCAVFALVAGSRFNTPNESPSVVADRFSHAVRANDADALARLLQPPEVGPSRAARAEAILAAVGDDVRAAAPSAPFVSLGDRVGDRSREVIVVPPRLPHDDVKLWLRSYDTDYPVGLHVWPRRIWVIHAVYDGDVPVGSNPAFDPRAGI